MVDRVLALPEGTRLYLLAPVGAVARASTGRSSPKYLKKGFQRVKIDGTFYELSEAPALDKNSRTTSTSWSTASWCGPTSPAPRGKALRPRESSPRGRGDRNMPTRRSAG